MSILIKTAPLFIIYFLPFNTYAQFYRISADFTIKEKKVDGTHSLTKGRVYYDINNEKIIYDITFPAEQNLVMKDTSMYLYRDGVLTDRQTVPNTNKFSVFHLSLNSHLDNYGLNNTGYKIEKVEKKDGMVMTTWLPPQNLRKVLGKVIVSQKDKQLFGVVFFDANNQIIGKQFYRNYRLVNGLNFPGEIVQVSIKEGKEFYKTTEFKNITINETQNDNKYNFSIAD